MSKAVPPQKKIFFPDNFSNAEENRARKPVRFFV